uniref:PIG-P domain-containing protein n=1 Tax=Zea mays TaxID=4577 RepID=A0A804P6V1_MAIZE
MADSRGPRPSVPVLRTSLPTPPPSRRNAATRRRLQLPAPACAQLNCSKPPALASLLQRMGNHQGRMIISNEAVHTELPYCFVKTMEWPPPSTSPSPSLVVRSPRQTVSLIRNRRPHRDWAPSSRSPSFAARDHGPKPSEVYGFVGSITTVIATAVYLAWAYTPEPVLRSLGITYYPSFSFVQVLGTGGAIVRGCDRGAVHGHLHGPQLRCHSSSDFLQHYLR